MFRKLFYLLLHYVANIPTAILSFGLDTVDAVCKMPQDTGPCRGSIRRWAYDTSKASCVEFTYGGCQGNANNFETQEACEAKCSGKLVLFLRTLHFHAKAFITCGNHFKLIVKRTGI